jgi:tetratricopeptide (TPR) repeat protein
LFGEEESASMKEEWYRRKTWTPADRQEFFTRLNRCRSTHNKAQYLSVQAEALRSIGNPESVVAALELIDLLLRDYPEPVVLARAYEVRAQCLSSQDNIQEAVAAYRNAFQTQRNEPSFRGPAHYDFAWMVATRQLTELYGEALAALDEFGEIDYMFPKSCYRSSGSRAMIQSALGDHNAARESARIALQAAAAEHSGFRDHARFGLVQISDPQAHERLEEIADAEPFSWPPCQMKNDEE